MPKLKVSLSIGYYGNHRKDILDINDELWDESDENQRNKLINEIAEEWAWHYIDLSADIVEGDDDES